MKISSEGYIVVRVTGYLVVMFFLIYAIDMIKGVNSYINLFANAKLLRKIGNPKNCKLYK